MKYYAFHTAERGVEVVQANGFEEARRLWTQRGGTGTLDWLVRYSAREHPAVMVLRRLGWRGTDREFALLLSPDRIVR